MNSTAFEVFKARTCVRCIV